MDEITLRPEIRQKLDEIESADIVVGIPSYNNAETIGHVVRAVQAGFAKYFSHKKCLLVNSDGGSTDGTMDVVQNAALDSFESILVHHRTPSMYRITTPYRGLPGKGSAFRTIFEIAASLKARACAVVDSDLRSITPEWIELLIKPVIENRSDYVAPLYHRHKFDGTITNSIIYPLTRALYGKRIRQPIGGDFGFSGELANFYLSKDVWNSDVARFGIDIWMTTTAIANQFRVCQSFLGAKIHDPKDPGADLSAMLYQVVSAALDLMEEYDSVWTNVKGSSAAETYGFHFDVGLEPVNVNIERMINRFRLGVNELTDIWSLALQKSIVDYLQKKAAEPSDNFNIEEEVWVEIIYSFALASQRKVINREHLLKSLTPLYIGRTASFIIKNYDNSASEVEKDIENLCLIFEQSKSCFINSWKENKGGTNE
ncbi:MAG: glycosyltransferase [Dissulfurispiraceae bacterium]|nr:glycosyltransferase [Dissulfurispiraceae bacterium]